MLKMLKTFIFAILLASSASYAQTPSKTETSEKPSTEQQPATITISDGVDEEQDGAKSAQPKEGVIVYDLSKAIKQALTISPSLDSARYDQEISEAQLAEANRARFVPQADLKVYGGYVPGVPEGSGPEGGFPAVPFRWSDMGPFAQIRFEAIQPIFAFGKINSLRRAALIGVDAKREGVDKARNELVYQVKRAYIGLTSLYSFQEFILELQSRAAKAKEVIQKEMQKKSSQVTNIDQMRVEVFQAETSRRLIEINNGIDFTLMTLKVLMGLPRDAKIDIAEQRLHMDTTVIQPVETYIQIAKQNRPEISQLQSLVEVREELMKNARSNYFPALGVIGFYRYGYAPNRQETDNPFLVDDFHQNSGGAFLGLTQSLGFHMTDARFKQARAQYDKAVADQQRALQGIEIEIRKAQSNAISKQQAVESAKLGFKTGRSWVLASTLNFGVGVGPPKDLLEAFIGYSTVKINYLQTLNDYFMALAELSNATGKEVTSLQY